MTRDMKKPLASWPGVDDFQKLLGEMKVPGIPDPGALVRAHQRNMEALSKANRIALEGAQAVAKRHMEIMQHTMAELADTLKTLAGGGAPQDKVAKQAEMLKTAYERAVTNTKEVGELIQRSNGEALDALNQRVAESIEELNQLIGPSRKP
jgi:phasin family protein